MSGIVGESPAGVGSSSVSALRERSSGQRKIVGLARIAAAGLIFAAIVTQIVDQLVNDAFVADEYFSYFTIDSSFINVVVLGVGGVLALRWARDPELYSAVRMSAVAYAVVTGAVYNVLLRGLPPTGFVGIQWPNEVMHVWIPIFILLDWILSPGRARLGWRRILFAVSFPVVWCIYTLVRGAVDGWYPYPFINPTLDGGYPSVVAYIVGLSAFIVALAAALIAISRLGARRSDPVV